MRKNITVKEIETIENETIFTFVKKMNFTNYNRYIFKNAYDNVVIVNLMLGKYYLTDVKMINETMTFDDFKSLLKELKEY